MNPKPETQQPNFRRIGLLYHPKLPQSRVMVAEMLEFIESFGVSGWVCSSWDEPTITQKIADTDLLITLGGDGSILRAARLAVAHGTLIMGVNLGRLGFLAEVAPAEWRDRFEQLLTGRYRIEARLMVQARIFHRGTETGHYHALNEVAISRGSLARVVRLKTFINQSYLTTYTADGMILSTPTGSTAYALAAGGPILPPELKNFLLIPLAPHLSLERAIVLAEGDTVRITVATDHTAILTVDGQFDIELAHDDTVEVSGSPQVSRFLRLQEKSYFYRTLMQRLGWGGHQ